jgi:hypothetical protein
LDGAPLSVAPLDEAGFGVRAAVDLTPGAHVFRVEAETVDGPAAAERGFAVVSAPREGWADAPGSGVAVSVPGGSAPLLVQRLDAPGEAGGLLPPAGDRVRILVGPEGAPVPPGSGIALDLPSGWPGARVERWDGASWVAMPAAERSAEAITVEPPRWGWFGLTRVETPPTPALAVLGAAPNPFGASATLSFVAPGRGRVRVEVFDVRGARVRGLAEREFAAGEHRLTWDGRTDTGRDAGGGIFFLRVSGAGEVRTVKVVRIPGGAEP